MKRAVSGAIVGSLVLVGPLVAAAPAYAEPLPRAGLYQSDEVTTIFNSKKVSIKWATSRVFSDHTWTASFVYRNKTSQKRFFDCPTDISMRVYDQNENELGDLDASDWTCKSDPFGVRKFNPVRLAVEFDLDSIPGPTRNGLVQVFYDDGDRVPGEFSGQIVEPFT
jgi:hypothetical protein